MNDMTDSDWKRLGQELVARRVALGFRTRTGFAAARGYKNDRVIAAIENAERNNFAPATLAAFEQDYEWARGSIEAVLRGEAPVPADRADRADEPVTPENIDPRLNNIERQIDALWKRIEQLEAPGGDQRDGTVTPLRSRTGPPEPPAEVPPVPEDVAANDPGEPSVGEQLREQQDRDAEAPD